jgi:hypothetical protein
VHHQLNRTTYTPTKPPNLEAGVPKEASCSSLGVPPRMDTYVWADISPCNKGRKIFNSRHRERPGLECGPVTRYAVLTGRSKKDSVIVTLCSSISRPKPPLIALPGSGLYQSEPVPIPPEFDLCRTPMSVLQDDRVIITYVGTRPSTTIPVVLR